MIQLSDSPLHSAPNQSSPHHPSGPSTRPQPSNLQAGTGTGLSTGSQYHHTHPLTTWVGQFFSLSLVFSSPLFFGKHNQSSPQDSGHVGDARWLKGLPGHNQ
uniref:Uncharacterized protein n=1 Tax=Opuntia streptacantha TaxID=393608 RepID=A0A7C9A6T2_OPUST